MRAGVKDYILNCVKCLAYSVPTGRTEGKLHIYNKGTRPFETLHIDHYGPLEKVGYGYKHIFIVIDACTKYVIIYPVKSTATKEVIACLKEYFRHFGVCKRIVSDRGSSLVSDEFANYLKPLNVEHVKVATASPQSNGQVERVNRFLRFILSKLSSEGKWTDFMAKSQFSVNNTTHKAIGTTSSLLLFGSDQYGFTDDNLREYTILYSIQFRI
ncbi:Pro-Pol polyprotein [Cyphomyrmex costatus]|uniref:Pro-Pol polyprotein n=1 Tax=Cyphomyrmex costatus TaxID=456900 RepID=A0A151IGA2_9HYME|nr:Pro-Pol polyprotein [Cyphomyrmex costatus]